MPNQGYGQLRKLAEAIGVHSTLISQILNGSKNLTVDQAILTSNFIGMNDHETEYFIHLVHLDRAGPAKTKDFLRRQIQKLKREAQDLNVRRAKEARLTEEQRSIFYSHWSYSAIRQLTAIKGNQESESLAKELKLPLQYVRQVIQFLLKSGLCVEGKQGLTIGPASTFIEKDSPWTRVHHANWRHQALAAMDSQKDEDFFFTSPLTLSKADAEKIKGMIVNFLESTNSVIDPSPSEELYCLNLDWFKVGKG